MVEYKLKDNSSYLCDTVLTMWRGSQPSSWQNAETDIRLLIEGGGVEGTLKLKSTENRRIINGGEMSRKIRQDHTRRETFPGGVNQFNVKKKK